MAVTEKKHFEVQWTSDTVNQAAIKVTGTNFAAGYDNAVLAMAIIKVSPAVNVVVSIKDLGAIYKD